MYHAHVVQAVLTFQISCRSYYKYYYNSRGLPVVGWNAGDKQENKQNVQR